VSTERRWGLGVMLLFLPNGEPSLPLGHVRKAILAGKEREED